MKCVGVCSLVRDDEKEREKEIFSVYFNCYMRRENNRGKSQIIMREEKPQERVVQLRQYQKEPNHLIVVVDWISLHWQLNIHLLVFVVGHLRIVSDHSTKILSIISSSFSIEFFLLQVHRFCSYNL